MAYTANEQRYESMIYHRCGRSGIKLPAISLGLWHNFGGDDPFENGRSLIKKAFDLGITHFDLANNYGSPAGSAEENFGSILKKDFSGYRDEMIISTKAGYGMWAGPYGDWGSRKYLVSSLDQSLKRMGLDYVDIFYHHRPDTETPLEETMMALDHVVRQGKALYVGISNYGVEDTKKAIGILKELGTPMLIHQAAYSMFNRWVEEGLTELLTNEGTGCIAFVPLAQGLLTNRYLNGVPNDSRALKPNSFLNIDDVSMEVISKVKKLNEIASNREQSLAQMALAWVLREQKITSALIGVSKVCQLEENVATLKNLTFSDPELSAIEDILGR
jgi:L-glyceraldehyde 3-phosphate reductase